MLPKLQKIWGDGGYPEQSTYAYCHEYKVHFEVVKRKEQRQFKVLPRRWVVERTIAWIGRNRRMSKDYEYRTSTSETLIYCAMIRLMLRRVACEIFTL
jgi:putative transposase